MNINNKFLVFVTVFLALLLFGSCTNRTPGINKPKCTAIAYPEDAHKVCNSFEYYGNKTWALDSVFCDGKDITDSVLAAVGGYYYWKFGDAYYDLPYGGYHNKASIQTGIGYDLPLLNAPSFTHQTILAIGNLSIPYPPFDTIKELAPLPFLHNMRYFNCATGTTNAETILTWEIISLSSSRMKMQHNHNNYFTVIFKVK
jgi:hypothetical protein